MRPSIRNMMVGVAEVIDGSIAICSLGTLHFALSFKATAWFSLRELRALSLKTQEG